MTHLIRAGIVLGVVLVAAFIVPRVIPVPESLQKFGFDKVNVVENNVAWASHPLEYADFEVCNTCHATEYDTWQLGNHQAISCETCHSPAYDHVNGGPAPEIDRSPQLCINCHGQTVSRPADFPQVDPDSHSGGLNCLTCHNPHNPLEFIPPAMPHPLQGRDNCESCHLPTEPIDNPPVVMHSLEGRENCVACHAPGAAGAAGIPLIPHPTEGRENCLLCHGSNSLVAYPADHAGRTADMCRTCHRTAAEVAALPQPAIEPTSTTEPVATPAPATTATAAPAATAATTPTATVASGPPAVPHSLDGRDNCLLCHDAGGLKPFPADHAGRTVDMCLFCHKTAS
jgi:hypothetical protein